MDTNGNRTSDYSASTAFAQRAAIDVFRTDFSAPGFALGDWGDLADARRFRAALVELCQALSVAYQQRFSRPLQIRSFQRFDQQRSTKPHYDGGPDESILVLGYEPTEVTSHLSLIDLSRAAYERGLEPQEFLTQFPPATPDGKAALQGYRRGITGLNWSHYLILVINNSPGPHAQKASGMLGVLHQATIDRPDPTKSRFVTSIMLIPGEQTASPDFESRVNEFIDSGTSVVF